MEAPSLNFVSRVLDNTTQTITLESDSGCKTIVIGDRINGGIAYKLQAGFNNLNINSIFNNFFTDTFQAANSLSGEGLAWLSGDLHTTFQTVLLDDGFGFTDTLLLRGRRSAGPSGSIIAAADGGEPLEASLGDGWSTWSKSAYRNASFDDTASNFGFAADGFSSAYGLDHAGGDWLTGVAVSYSTLTSKQDVTGDKGDLQAFKAGLYASYHPGDWTITGSATGSFQSIKSKRLITLPTPFAVTGLEPSRFGGIIGAGLTLASSTNWQATLSYDAEIRGHDVLHTARGGLTWAF